MGLKNPNPKTDWKPGDIAYYFDSWSEQLICGKIDKLFDVPTKDGRKLTAARFRDGIARSRLLDELFINKKSALESYEQSREDKIAAYMSTIQSVNDLVAFGYTKNVAHAEEYTNYEAREAYRRKAKELLNLDLS